MDLIVGATGMVGGEVCRLLTEQGRAVRALVRKTSNPDKVERLRSMGIDVVRGDLKDRPSLDAACRGASTVVSTASSTISRAEGDSIESVDLQGQQSLIEAAEAAGVGQFVLTSFPGTALEHPLQSAKRAAEDRLKRGRMGYTILQPTCFTEVWLSPVLGFDPAHGTAQMFGEGHNKVSWISFQDVARFAASVLDHPKAKKAVVKLGGPDALGPLEVVRLAEQAFGKKIAVQHVPEAALAAQHAAATDPMQKSFAGLMLYCAGGDAIDMTETLRTFPVQGLRSVREHLAALAK